MTEPDRRPVLRQALRGTGFVLALGAAIIAVALVIAWSFTAAMT